MSTTDDKATIEGYEDFDDYEGSYDVYVCGNCGKYLTNSIDIALGYDTMPKTCPRCGKELVW